MKVLIAALPCSDRGHCRRFRGPRPRRPFTEAQGPPLCRRRRRSLCCRAAPLKTKSLCQWYASPRARLHGPVQTCRRACPTCLLSNLSPLLPTLFHHAPPPLAHKHPSAPHTHPSTTRAHASAARPPLCPHTIALPIASHPRERAVPYDGTSSRCSHAAASRAGTVHPSAGTAHPGLHSALSRPCGQLLPEHGHGRPPPPKLAHPCHHPTATQHWQPPVPRFHGFPYISPEPAVA